MEIKGREKRKIEIKNAERFCLENDATSFVEHI